MLVNKFAKQLRKIRLEHNLSLVELSGLIDGAKSDKVLSQYELRKAEPNLDILCALANVFECSLDYLICDQENIPLELNEPEEKYLLRKDEEITALKRELSMTRTTVNALEKVIELLKEKS